jgi:predicted 2-oxoglutarate/Fe(II)-dependent dioxygenase YbiX
MDHGTDDAAEIVADEIVRQEAVRRARSIEVDGRVLDLVEGRLDAARPVIERALGVPLGLREGAGFLRYQAGGFYRPHRDRGRVAGWTDAARRLVTVVVFLNGSGIDGDEFDGGHLCIYPEDAAAVQISPQTGLLVAFPSRLLHEVLPVLPVERDGGAGTRDTIVDWFYDG